MRLRLVLLVAALAVAAHLAMGQFAVNHGVFGGHGGGHGVPANPASGFGWNQPGWGNPWGDDDKGGHGGLHGPGKPGVDDKGPGKPGFDDGFRHPPPPLGGGYNGPLRPDEAMLYQTVVHADLSGFEEVPPICTKGRGEFDAWIPWDGDRIDWQMTLWGCDTIPTSAAIHMGLPGNEGPVVAQLCSDNNDDRKKWGCGKCELSVDNDFGNGDFRNRNRVHLKGTIRASDIHAVPSSNIDEDDLKCFIKAMQFESPIGLSAMYVEVTTEEFPSGELRGQLVPRSFSSIFKKGHGDDGLGKHKLAEREGFHGFK